MFHLQINFSKSQFHVTLPAKRDTGMV
jgi:hypothetical protein